MDGVIEHIDQRTVHHPLGIEELAPFCDRTTRAHDLTIDLDGKCSLGDVAEFEFRSFMHPGVGATLQTFPFVTHHTEWHGLAFAEHADATWERHLVDGFAEPQVDRV